MSWQKSVTEEEKKAVEEFRRRMESDCTSKMLEDNTLFYRFMKARDFNLKNAEEMLKKHIAWRKEYQIDTILTDYQAPETIVKCTPITFLGFDKEGAIVKHVDVGRSDSKGVLNSVKRIDILKYNLQIYEEDLMKLKEHSEKIGRTVNRIVYIYNLDKMTLAKATNKKAMEFMIFASKMYQDNYPEHIKNMFIINGYIDTGNGNIIQSQTKEYIPAKNFCSITVCGFAITSIYFTMLFSVLKTCIAAPIIEKIRFFGSEGYKEALVEVIDADVLPGFLGGSRTDPDGNPNCNTFMLWGENVPEELYLRKSEKLLCTVPGVKKLSVTRFAKSEFKFEVNEPGSLLEWEFETRTRDIGFGLRFEERESEQSKKSVELIPLQRFDTCFEPETGIYKCEKPGTYTIIFDNSYSWIHTKDIFYRARITHPNDKRNPN